MDVVQPPLHIDRKARRGYGLLWLTQSLFAMHRNPHFIHNEC
jgi:hypothetical protein